MGLKSKKLAPSPKKTVEEETSDDLGLDVDDIDVGDPDLDMDEELEDDDDEPAPPKKGRGRPAGAKNKKAPAPMADEEDDLGDLGDIDEIDEIDMGDDITEKQLQASAGSGLSPDFLPPLLDKLASAEEHIEVIVNNVANRLNSWENTKWVDMATGFNNIILQQEKLYRDVTAIMHRLAAIEACFDGYSKVMHASINGSKSVENEVPKPAVAKKEKAVADEPQWAPAHISYTFDLINKQTKAVSWAKLLVALDKKFGCGESTAASMLVHMGYKEGLGLEPGAINLEKYEASQKKRKK